MSKKKIRNIVMTVVFFVLIGMAVCYFIVPNESIKALLFSLLSSILSAMLFVIISDYIFNQKSDELDLLGKIAEALLSLKSRGVVGLRSRDEYDNEFWISFLRNADKQLVVSGRTLNRWLDENLILEFKKCLLRMIKAKKEVCLIIYKEQLLDDKEKMEINRLKNFLNEYIFEYCIIEEYKSNRWKIDNNCRLSILEIQSLPYLFASNGEQLVVGSYFSNVSNSKNLLLVLKYNSHYGSTYSADFRYIMDIAKANKWLREYIANKNTERSSNSMNVINEISTNNIYSGSNWEYEETKKYIIQISKGILEAGFYIHYDNKKDRNIIKHVIEMPTSCGCAMKCQYCASSYVENSCNLTSEDLFSLFELIYEKNLDKIGPNLLVTLTGTGDLFFTMKDVEPFIVGISKKYTHNIQITVSSCHWTIPMLDRMKMISESVSFRAIQWSFITNKRLDLQRIIPLYQTLEFDFSTIIEYIRQSNLNCFRINYLMIKEINDSEENFNEFINLFNTIKNKIVVRISCLNQTQASKRNNLETAEIKKMNIFKGLLFDNGFKVYLFYAHQNDNMNCGQMITENQTILYS